MTFTHATTGVEYDTQESLVEHLIDTYVGIQRDKYQLQQAEASVIANLENLVEYQRDNVKKKTVVLRGLTQLVKLVARENVSYAKAEDGVPGLKSLASRHPLLESDDMVRVDYKEKGTQIEKFLVGYLKPDGEQMSAEEMKLGRDLCELRATKKGKPTITVEDMKDE
jgi:Asp-tRNA(Asn)/Glu-tRNA(Gln) amidotransferase B subunit